METEKLQEQVLNIGERCFDKSKLTKDEKRLLISAYFQVTRERLRDDCSNCFAKIYLFFNSKQIKTMSNLKFKIKDGMRITLHGMSEVVTNGNLTNEKALDILKRAPGAIKMFEVYPDDWRFQAEAQYKKNLSAKKPVAGQPAPASVDATEKSAEPTKEFSVDETEKELTKVKRDRLNKATEKELKEMCKSFELDEKEYAKLKKPALVKLLMEKTS